MKQFKGKHRPGLSFTGSFRAFFFLFCLASYIKSISGDGQVADSFLLRCSTQYFPENCQAPEICSPFKKKARRVKETPCFHTTPAHRMPCIINATFPFNFCSCKNSEKKVVFCVFAVCTIRCLVHNARAIYGRGDCVCMYFYIPNVIRERVFNFLTISPYLCTTTTFVLPLACVCATLVFVFIRDVMRGVCVFRFHFQFEWQRKGQMQSRLFKTNFGCWLPSLFIIF